MDTPQNKQYLGIDIGGTTAKYALISDRGDIRCKSSFSTGKHSSKSDFLQSLFRVTDWAVDLGVKGIGICSLGIINPDSGAILGGVQNMPYLHGVNFLEVLAERYPHHPVRISNDVKAIARGEQWMGAARDCSNFFCIALGTGLGGALVLDSKLVEGTHYRAGEICYVNYRNNQDYLEKYTSTKYMMKLAARTLGVSDLDGFEFFHRVHNGDPACCNILDVWIHTLARFVANILIILDLEKVIIGGGISKESDILIPRLTKAVSSMLPPEFRGQASIEAAQCANDAGMLGAISLLALQDDRRKKIG